jgi:hypothetical protein
MHKPLLPLLQFFFNFLQLSPENHRVLAVYSLAAFKAVALATALQAALFAMQANRLSLPNFQVPNFLNLRFNF